MGVTEWLRGWKAKGWRKADGKPVMNHELWMQMDALMIDRKITWRWVKGHADHPDNERVNGLANWESVRAAAGAGTDPTLVEAATG